MRQRYIEVPTTILQPEATNQFNVYLKTQDGYTLYAAKDITIKKSLVSALENIYMKAYIFMNLTKDFTDNISAKISQNLPKTIS